MSLWLRAQHSGVSATSGVVLWYVQESYATLYCVYDTLHLHCEMFPYLTSLYLALCILFIYVYQDLEVVEGELWC